MGVPYLGVLIIWILLFRVLYSDPLFLETPIFFAVHTPLLCTGFSIVIDTRGCQRYHSARNNGLLVV